MSKKMKLRLEDLRVQSFVTDLDEEKDQIVGGGVTVPCHMTRNGTCTCVPTPCRGGGGGAGGSNPEYTCGPANTLP